MPDSRFPDLPERMKSLPVDHRGFPVPWFVAWVDGKPVFPAMDSDKLRQAIHYGKCWVCGQPLGRFKYWVIGPMCVINRVSSEPPSHQGCALFSVKNCPFLANPRMGRVPRDKYGGKDAAGIMLDRNPGATALIETQGPITFHSDGRGGVLFEVKPIASVSWWAEGRTATAEEVKHSIETGLPALRKIAEEDRAGAVAALDRKIEEAREWMPKEVAT